MDSFKILNSEQETFETWNKVAGLYQDKFMDLNLYDDTYNFFCNNINKQNANILDVGCGPGNIIKYLLNKCPNFNVIGIDYAPNMIKLARGNNPNARFKIMDCRNIDQLDGEFDGIICGFCLPYMSASEAEKFISVCSSKLVINGLLYISFVEGDSSKSGFQVGSSGDKVFFNFHQLKKIETTFWENELTVLKIFSIEYIKSGLQKEFHTVIIAKKKK